MREDIDKDRKFMTKAWAKREAQVSAMIESTVGMVGDLHSCYRPNGCFRPWGCAIQVALSLRRTLLQLADTCCGLISLS